MVRESGWVHVRLNRIRALSKRMLTVKRDWETDIIRVSPARVSSQSPRQRLRRIAKMGA